MYQNSSRHYTPHHLVLILVLALAFAWMPGFAWAQTSDVSETRLFFGPTARSLPPGKGYVGVWEVLLPVTQVGVTDRFSLGGGLPWPMLAESEPVFWLTPKFEVYRGDRTSVAAGIMAGVAIHHGIGGFAYGVVTTGGPDAAVSLAVFAPLVRNDSFPAMVMFGVEKRVSDRVRFISENWVFGTSGVGLATGGVRVSGKRVAADFALGLLIDSDHGVYPVPIINVMWKF
ncbi:MAG: hypothetical protein NT151_02470 [Acidobacteria bacterium]|nr:hypothetical protein [Acidobacteriota bacterium]